MRLASEKITNGIDSEKETKKTRSKNQKRLRMFACLAVAFGIGQGLTSLLHWPWLYWLVTIPGTFFHESAHWIFALMLGGSPSTFSIFPTLQGDPSFLEILFTQKGSAMQSMGHVIFAPNWYNAASIGMAPLLLGLLGVQLAALSCEKKTWTALPMGYMTACCFASMWPSSADWSIAASRPLSFLIATPIFSLIFWISLKSIFKIIR